MNKTFDEVISDPFGSKYLLMLDIDLSDTLVVDKTERFDCFLQKEYKSNNINEFMYANRIKKDEEIYLKKGLYVLPKNIIKNAIATKTTI